MPPNTRAQGQNLHTPAGGEQVRGASSAEPRAHGAAVNEERETREESWLRSQLSRVTSLVSPGAVQPESSRVEESGPACHVGGDAAAAAAAPSAEACSSAMGGLEPGVSTESRVGGTSEAKESME